MKPFIILGTSTNVGKTVVSSILTLALKGNYWKPIETGERDSTAVLKWLSSSQVIPPAYSLKAPLSPHHAAYLENIILPSKLPLPSYAPLIIESVGGVLSPLRVDLSAIDFFSQWSASWILVSKHELGSINQTLLTLEALKKRSIIPLGIIFNGFPCKVTEEPILQQGIPLIGHLLPEPVLNFDILQQYGDSWVRSFPRLLKKN